MRQQRIQKPRAPRATRRMSTEILEDRRQKRPIDRLRREIEEELRRVDDAIAEALDE